MREWQLTQMLADRAHLNYWQLYTQFARDIYGEQAAQVEIESVWERVEGPGAEGALHATIVDIRVSDPDDARLEPLLSTPWWRQQGIVPDLHKLDGTVRDAAILLVL